MNRTNTNINDDLNSVIKDRRDNPFRKRWGLAAVGITGTLAIGLSVVTYPFVSPAFRRICLPYVPATTRQIDNVLRLCRKRGGSLIDLGSGDGRIVFAAAKDGYKATGIELNIWLVMFSKIKAALLRIKNSATFERQDIFKKDLGGYDNIVIFGVPDLMEPLKLKLQKEMHLEARVLTCRFPIPGCYPAEVIDEGIDSVWMYTIDDICHEHKSQFCEFPRQ